MNIKKCFIIIFVFIVFLCGINVFASTEEKETVYNIKELMEKYNDKDIAFGIDVSKWQGNIDWKKVADSNVKYVMIRCGYRGYSEGTVLEDPKFQEYIKGALENKLKVGVYFFSSAINEEEAIEEAKFVLECVKDYKITYPIAYDFEYFGELFGDEEKPYRTNGLTKEQINKNAKAFIDYIKNNSEYKTMLYASSIHLKDTFDVTALGIDNNIWVAEYNKTIDKNVPNYKGTYAMWQCTDKGQVPGISTKVDINFDYKYYSYYEKNEEAFKDVKKDDWFYEAIKYCKDNEIILGYGETREYFKPSEKMTRGMFVTILHRMAGEPKVDAGTSKNFPDVNQSEYYAEAIKWASAVKIVNGYNEGTFGPNDSIKRQDMAIIIRNYAKEVLGKDVSIKDENSLLKFSDNQKVEEYAKESVIWAIQNRVITGKEDKYIDPIGTATRAETASMIFKYDLKNIEDKKTL